MLAIRLKARVDLHELAQTKLRAPRLVPAQRQ
jgi:hypothetical protein